MKTTHTNAKIKREITPHKGGRTERINCRATPETKRLFLKLSKEKEMQQIDFLEYLIKKEAKRISLFYPKLMFFS